MHIISKRAALALHCAGFQFHFRQGKRSEPTNYAAQEIDGIDSTQLTGQKDISSADLAATMICPLPPISIVCHLR